MPWHLTVQLVAQIKKIEQGKAAWPDACMVGIVTAIEKHSLAAAPADYRPITMLSMIYRAYSSIRTKTILRWLHGLAPDDLKGNMPNQTTIQVGVNWPSASNTLGTLIWSGQA